MGSLSEILRKCLISLQKTFLKENANLSISLNYHFKNSCGNPDIKYHSNSEEKVKLLQIHTDNRLNFDYYISQLCKNAWERLHATLQMLL